MDDTGVATSKRPPSSRNTPALKRPGLQVAGTKLKRNETIKRISTVAVYAWTSVFALHCAIGVCGQQPPLLKPLLT